MVNALKNFKILSFTLLLLGGILFARVTYLIFFNTKAQQFNIGKPIQRGTIFDRRGIELALSLDSYTIGIQPQFVYDPTFTADYLAPILNIPKEKIESQIREKPNYFLLKREIDLKSAKQIQSLALPGVRVEKEFKRYYPNERLASSLLGFTGFDDDKALSGLENEFNLELLSSNDSVAGKGNDLWLTIDSMIQYKLEKSLGLAFQKTGSKKAVGLFLEASTGRILAMASFPNFNPNEYSSFSAESHTNWALRHTYEPGSTLKVFIALMLFNEKKLSLSDRFYCPGHVEVGKNIVRCGAKHGSIGIEEILQVSCNVGIIKAIQRLPEKVMYQYLERLNFGKRSGFSLKENKGYLPPLEKWRPATPYFLSIGQGLSVTPIQLVASAASLINGGNYIEPYVVSHITNSYGELVHQFEKKGTPLGFSKVATSELMNELIQVVKKGTGKNAYMENYSIAGKTGTGQKATPGKGYEEGLFSASFLGFFPGESPKVVGLILLDEPKGGNHSGGGVAAPIFREVVESILPIIAKTDTAPSYHLTELPRIQIEEMGELVPDFTGYTKREVSSVLTKEQILFQFQGEGYVYKQDPKSGSEIDRKQIWKLYFKQ